MENIHSTLQIGIFVTIIITFTIISFLTFGIEYRVVKTECFKIFLFERTSICISIIKKITKDIC